MAEQHCLQMGMGVPRFIVGNAWAQLQVGCERQALEGASVLNRKRS